MRPLPDRSPPPGKPTDGVARLNSDGTANKAPVETPQPTASSAPAKPTQSMRHAVQLGDALWSGLGTYARRELEGMATDASSELGGRAAAAHEMAVWHLYRNDVDEADRWRGLLDDDVLEHAVVATLIDQRCGRVEEARARLEQWINRRPDDPHLKLHLANIRNHEAGPGPAGFELFNDVLAAGGAALAVSPEPGAGPLGLTVEQSQLLDRPDGPLVTVIMPAFNAESTIGPALDSLLAQTHRRLQVIVVDDSSIDDTAAIAQAAAAADDRIVVLSQDRNCGAYAARNVGLERAEGAYVTVHDADDWAHPERIERQVRDLEDFPTVPANVTDWVRADADLVFQPHGRHPYKIVGKSTASLMVRRELFGVVGPWDHHMRGAADFEMLRRLQTRFGAVHHLSKNLPLAVSLRTPSSLTGSSATGIQSLWLVNGARRQYLERFVAWNRDDSFPASLPFDARHHARPFPVPALLLGGPTDTMVDVVVTADFTSGSPSVLVALDDACSAQRDGRSVALFHQPNSLEALQHDLDERVVEALRKGRLRLLSAGETVRCVELRHHGGGVPGGALEGGPEVIADREVR
jgi:hypothetical protein